MLKKFKEDVQLDSVRDLSNLAKSVAEKFVVHHDHALETEIYYKTLRLLRRRLRDLKLTSKKLRRNYSRILS